MISLIHPGCNANVRAVAQTFQEAGKLDCLFTSITDWKGGWFFRQYPGVDRNKIRTLAYREWMRLICAKTGFRSCTRHEVGHYSVDRVWMEIDRWASTQIPSTTKIVYSYEDGALNTFEEARKKGLKKIYDLPIGYWRVSREIYEEEADLCPEFAPLLEGLQDSPEKLNRKDRELELADRVYACSSFVKSTLTKHGYPEGKIRMVQFGSPEIQDLALSRNQEQRASLKILFVGRLDQRKGIGYLLKAMEHFDPLQVEFHIVGTKPSQMEILEKYWGRVIDHGTLMQEKVWNLMRKCDVFVLPTLFEGQALVVLEAMACGLPVIVTPNAGADQVVRNGKDGFIIPIRSAVEIVNKIQHFLDHPEDRQKMGNSARQRSREFTWARYRADILKHTLELHS